MKRKSKIYSRPKRPFDKKRIDEEAEIKKIFGLKNKKEIWKAEAKIKSFREKAKKLISAEESEQEKLFTTLRKIGLNINSVSDILSLNKKDYLERRFQTRVSKKFSVTPKKARQLITHKKVSVKGRIVDVPSYIIPIEYEKEIIFKTPIKKEKSVEKNE